jgi:hypothetical protein
MMVVLQLGSEASLSDNLWRNFWHDELITLFGVHQATDVRLCARAEVAKKCVYSRIEEVQVVVYNHMGIVILDKAYFC